LLDLVLPTIKTTKTQGHYSCYEIGPHLSGFSTPFANGLRRVLLSSLSGAALTSVLIEGVFHEFQDILDVKEDVTDIVQNLKKVRLRCFSDHPVKVYLDVQGACLVTAADIVHPQTIEIVNHEAHIATLDNANAHLVMNMTVSTGRGFVAAGAIALEAPPIGLILIDALYSPVLHVNFTIDPVAGRKDYDTIVFELTTDGTISPDEALSQSAALLLRQFSVFQNYWYVDVPTEHPTLTNVPIPLSIYNIPIEGLHLPFRSYNALRRASLTKVGHVLEMDEEDLLALRNVGVKTVQELCACLRNKGLLPQGAIPPK
jgi:DNA-directed RNA polymerase subunit alpha